ncbi:MAG: hypothetical protein ING36_10450 [Burkholderiales bacterium]|jgi:hypothetical protein|nr:hypothetical protein [Burkholderiales bacterium]
METKANSMSMLRPLKNEKCIRDYSYMSIVERLANHNEGLGATMRTAETIERAIEIVLETNDECQVEWYSLGKTNADLREYMLEHAIESEEQGVFIGGNKDENKKLPLTLMPISWIKVDEKLPARLAWKNQFDEYQRSRSDTP